jgi:lysophospholipid acyltransferase (LPLAT)-like uncharacterized protein
MSIKSDLIMSLGSTLGPAIIRALGSTWIIRQSGIGPYYQRMHGSSKRVVYSFWHRDILTLGYFARDEGIRVLISEHRDGELIARIVQKMGYTVFRGSTTRGGVVALRAMDRIRYDPSRCDMAITPDGPKGPAKKLQQGVIFAASRTGFPVVPIGVAVDRCWEMNSWDRFRVPKPFSHCFVFYGTEIDIPEGLNEADIERWKETVGEAMDRAETRAKIELKHWCNGEGHRSQD